jgi:Eukaryotic aspartyl protease
VPSSNCVAASAGGCASKRPYSLNSSSSAVDQNSKFFIPYGTGYVLCEKVRDVVDVGGASIQGQQFGEATTMAKFFESFPVDGILGLGFEDISASHSVPPFFQMINQSLIDAPEFTMYFSATSGDNTSFVEFGGDEPSTRLSDFEFADLVADNYWLTKTNSITVGNTTTTYPNEDDALTVVDSGTSIVVGIPSVIEPIIKAVGNVAADCSNVDSLPVVHWNLNGVSLDIPPQFYVVRQPNSQGVEQCSLGFISTILSYPLTILGDPAFMAYNIKFDASTDPARVGFAKSINWKAFEN